MLDYRTSNKPLDLDAFSIPLNVAPASASPELQLDFIKLQSDDTMKALYQNKPLLKFYHVYISKIELPNLRAQTLKCSSIFRKHVPMRAFLF